MAAEGSTSLLVRNIADRTSSEDLRAAFSRFGAVKDVYLPLNYHTKRRKGFGFVQFESEKDADDALRGMDRMMLDDRELEVVVAQRGRKTSDDMRRRDGGGYGRPERGGYDRPRYDDRSDGYRRSGDRYRDRHDRQRGFDRDSRRFDDRDSRRFDDRDSRRFDDRDSRRFGDRDSRRFDDRDSRDRYDREPDSRSRASFEYRDRGRFDDRERAPDHRYSENANHQPADLEDGRVVQRRSRSPPRSRRYTSRSPPQQRYRSRSPVPRPSDAPGDGVVAASPSSGVAQPPQVLEAAPGPVVVSPSHLAGDGEQ